MNECHLTNCILDYRDGTPSYRALTPEDIEAINEDLLLTQSQMLYITGEKT